MPDRICFQLAVFQLPSSTVDSAQALDSLLANEFSSFDRVEALSVDDVGTTIAARLEEDVKANYTPPELDSLQYFGRGLTREQAEQLQDARSAIILDFGLPKDQRWDGLRTAYSIASALAQQTGGLIWDEETREVFTIASWQEKRLEKWTEEIPDISEHTVIHAYNTGEHVRANFGHGKIRTARCGCGRFPLVAE